MRKQRDEIDVLSLLLLPPTAKSKFLELQGGDSKNYHRGTCLNEMSDDETTRIN